MTWEPEPPFETPDTRIEIGGLKQNTAYNVRIRSVSGTGKQKRMSFWTQFKTMTILSTPQITDILLDYYDDGDEGYGSYWRIKAFFAPVLGATAYEAQWSRNNGATWLPNNPARQTGLIGTLETNGFLFFGDRVTNVYPDTNLFRVRAVHIGTSTTSDWWTTDFAPSGASATERTNDSLTIEWTGSGDVNLVQTEETV